MSVTKPSYLVLVENKRFFLNRGTTKDDQRLPFLVNIHVHEFKGFDGIRLQMNNEGNLFS